MSGITIESTTDVEAPVQETASASNVDQESAPEQESEQKSAEKSDNSEEVEDQDESEDENSEEESEDQEKKKEGEEQPKPKKKGGFQRRIDKLRASVSAKELEIEHWKNLALKEKAEGKDPEKTVETKKTTDQAGKPNQDDYELYDEYLEALTDWKADQKFKEYESRLEKSKIETAQEKMISSHRDRVEKFAKTVDDFDEVLEEVSDVVPSPTMQELLISSENGPALMYSLAKDRDTFERLNKLSPLAAAKEIGKLESMIEAKTSGEKREVKKTTTAPRPITPVKTKGGTKEKSIFDEDLSQKEYEALRAKSRSA